MTESCVNCALIYLTDTSVFRSSQDTTCLERLPGMEVLHMLGGKHNHRQNLIDWIIVPKITGFFCGLKTRKKYCLCFYHCRPRYGLAKFSATRNFRGGGTSVIVCNYESGKTA